MKNYIIEGNIDFFSEIYSSLDITENEQKMPEDENLCLISNEPLKDNYIKLHCGHKFNYIPIFNDIKNHKQKFNYLEDKNTHLKVDEIRCPYCRNKQRELLPYFEELGIPKVHGINYINNGIICKNCDYLIPNELFDPNGNNPIEVSKQYENSNSKFFNCNNYGLYQIDKCIDNYTGNGFNFCHYHKKIVINEHNKKIKQKEKEEKQKVKQEHKQKEKEDKQKEKQKEKEDKQKEKQKEKEEIKLKTQEDKQEENVIIGSSHIHIHNNNGCIEIIKYGSKKGSICGCKIFENEKCKRHIIKK
jgi:hypothetical protein